MNELISIIVPIYNVEKYLLECLESLLAQTYKTLEIILVDDGSTDQSNEIAQRFISTYQDERIQLINKVNGGQSSARNLGMAQTKGTYIIFIDSDDLVSTTHVEMLYTAVREKDAKLAMCKMTKKRTELSESYSKQNDSIKGDFLTLVDQLYASDYPSAAAWGKIYHRSLLEQVKFQEGMIYEDGLFFYEIIHQVNEIVLIDVMSYFYRTVESSTLIAQISQKNFDILQKNELTFAFFKENHPEAMNHFYQKALNVNDFIAVKCIKDKTPLSLKLFNQLYIQNQIYSKNNFPRKLMYLSQKSYYGIIFVLSKIYKVNAPDQQKGIKIMIKQLLR